MNKLIKSLSVSAVALVVFTGFALAVSTVLVTPLNTQGWSTADTRTGGAVTYVTDATSPVNGNGALQLTTDATITSKAQYMHADSTPLADVSDLSYQTKQVTAAFAGGDASYQLAVFLGGGTTGFTTFVYEPYENGTVVPSVWQNWDVDAGQMWSSRTYTDGGTCSVQAGFGGAPFYTLAGIKTMCPNAVVAGFGVNIGSNNPSYDVYADFVNFNGTTYDFAFNEPTPTPIPTVTPTPVVGPPVSKDACKNNGWKAFNSPSFKNQGECVSYTNHN